MLRTNLIKPACWLPALLAFSLTGCGVTQGITDGTKSAFNAVFYKKIKVLHLDFTAREALNTDTRESNSLSEPVVVRIYQLKDRKTFDKTVYQQLLKDGEAMLETDLLATRDVVVKPGGDTNLDMPMEDEAQFVAVVGLFRHPDMVKNTWKQVLKREDLDPDKPRILEAGKTQQLLAQLLQLKPDWAVSYGDRLVQQALTLWPEEAKPLAQQWQKQMSINALAKSDLNGWHEGMTQLQQLTTRLNALDEQKGKYMTVSELKSAVFAMSQSFGRTVPLEEQLRLLSALPAGQPLSAAQQNQTEQHLQQLIASYALLKHKKEQ